MRSDHPITKTFRRHGLLLRADADVRLPAARVTHDDCAAEGERGQCLPGQVSAYAIHHDVDTLSVGDAQRTIFHALDYWALRTRRGRLSGFAVLVLSVK